MVHTVYIHNFPIGKTLSSNGLVPKRSTSYYAIIRALYLVLLLPASMLCVKSFGDVDILYIFGNVNYVGYVGHLRQLESVVFKAAFIKTIATM